MSNMLTYVEVPGLYVQPDTGFISAIDHIDVEFVEKTDHFLKLKVSNPTKFSAKVKIFSENSSNMSKIFGQNMLWGCETLVLEAGGEKEILFATALGEPIHGAVIHNGFCFVPESKYHGGNAAL